jgi:regulator of RNase E activity RraA
MGDLQSLSAKLGGLSGAVIDGACRDIDAVRDIGFPMFTRGVVCMTARGRIQQEAYNVMVQIGGVQVRPGDWIIADGSGVVVVPQEHAEEVVAAAEAIVAREEAMAEAVRSGRTILDVMTNFNYEHMLQEKAASKES